jgi:hypothetical protein
MTVVREFAERDIPEAVELLARVSPEHGWQRREDCAAYFREMLFHNPWLDPGVPSWVAWERGRMAGFYAVMPRPMLLRGRRIRAAVGCQLSVLPEHRRSLATLKLLQACLRGPQDLTLADGAHERTRHMWASLGGAVPAVYGLNWILPLQPAQFLLSLLQERDRLPAALCRLARPFAALADRWLSRQPPTARPPAVPLQVAELGAGDILSEWRAECGSVALCANYERGAVEWMLMQLARTGRLGRLRGRSLREGARTVGWYLYFVQSGGIGEVVHLAARPERYGEALDRLCEDAARHGLAALRGRLDPRHVEEHAQRGCWFRREGQYTLVHSRDRAVLDAFRRADAIVSRMDGEWWLRFVGG